MKKDEIIERLIHNKVIFKLKDEYYFNEDYDTLKDKKEGTTLNVNVQTSLFNIYPEVIDKVAANKKLEAVYNYCKVPLKFKPDMGTPYLVRSLDKNTKEAMRVIMQNSTYTPSIVLELIKDYYKYSNYPKAFKRFIVEDFVTAYALYESGESFKPDKINDIKWQ